MRAIIAAGLLLTLAGWTGAQPVDTGANPCTQAIRSPAEAHLLAVRTDGRQQDMKVHAVRLDKASYVVSRLYAHTGRADFRPHVGYLIAEHERIERVGLASGDKRSSGYGSCYWWSLVYGASNFSLRCWASAPGSCRGPMDVKHYPPISEPRANIRYHVAEMHTGYKQGYRGRGLCEYVFLPAAPRDWGWGRFRRTDARLRECLARGQRLGLVRPAERNAVKTRSE